MPTGIALVWWRIRWWRRRLWFKLTYWWAKHPRRSPLWKAHYQTHSVGQPWYLGVPRSCRYCMKAFWQQNKQFKKGQPLPPRIFEVGPGIEVIKEEQDGN